MWALALGFGAWSVWLWPDLPARIPTHFDLSGTPDAWSARSVWSWFGLPLITLGTVLFLDVVTRWSLRNPEAPALNLPNKAAILALPAKRRAPVLARVAWTMYAIGTVCVVAFILIQFGTLAEAQGAGGQGWILAGILVTLIAPLAMLVVGLVRIDAEVKRQREAS